jgi:hydrogenase maturation protein HypF
VRSLPGEYEDPLDRRFHAQPNACPDCGPSLRLVDRAGRSLAEGTERARGGASWRCAEGRIVAVKGSAAITSPAALTTRRSVAELRARKHREDKPFALMAPSPRPPWTRRARASAGAC